MLITLLISFASILFPIDLLTYADPAGRYAVKYPQGWELNLDKDVLSFLAAPESDSDRFRENVNILIKDLSAEPTTMADYTRITKEWIASSKGELLLEKEIALAGNPATEVVYILPKGVIDPDLELMFHQVWIIKNEKAYLLTFCAEPDKYEQYEKEGAEIFKSFVLPTN
jgi:eukaryotic-like serine/threonine-protein kinase